MLVHAASGGFVPTDPMEVEPALFAEAHRRDADGRLLLRAGRARARWATRGVIVNITDVAALEAWPLFAPHAAAKAALAQLTRSLARAFAPGRARVRRRAGARAAARRQRRGDGASAQAAAPRSAGWARPRTSWGPSRT